MRRPILWSIGALLIACGGKSPAVTVGIAEAVVAGLPQGRLATVADADHGMLTTLPEKTARLIADFFS